MSVSLVLGEDFDVNVVTNFAEADCIKCWKSVRQSAGWLAWCMIVRCRLAEFSILLLFAFPENYYQVALFLIKNYLAHQLYSSILLHPKKP